jgi:hypothetical protein
MNTTYYSANNPLTVLSRLFKDIALTDPVDAGYYSNGTNCIRVNNSVMPGQIVSIDPCGTSVGQFTVTFSEVLYNSGTNKNSFKFILTATNGTDTLANDVNIRVKSGFVFGMANTNDGKQAFVNDTFSFTIPAGSGNGDPITFEVNNSTPGAPIEEGPLAYFGPSMLELIDATTAPREFTSNPGAADVQTGFYLTSANDEVNLVALGEGSIIAPVPPIVPTRFEMTDPGNPQGDQAAACALTVSSAEGYANTGTIANGMVLYTAIDMTTVWPGTGGFYKIANPGTGQIVGARINSAGVVSDMQTCP